MSVSKFVNVYLPIIVKYDFDVIPVMVGNPGISKTAQLHQMCEKMNWGLVPVHLALRPIESLSGLPEIKRFENELHTEWSMPEVISKANELAKEHEKVILFFDDIHLADKSRQAYFFELASERALQGHKLADNVKIVCAGNPTAKAGAKTFLTAIINRFTFIDVGITLKDWQDWAIGNSNKYADFSANISPADVEKVKSYKIHPLVLGFLIDGESKLSEGENTQPFASPRSWYFMSEWTKIFELLYGDTNNWKDDVIMDFSNIAKGTIGASISTEFITFIKYTYDIDIEKIMKDPKELLKIQDKEKRIAAYALVMARLTDPKNRKYCVRFVDFAYYILGNNGKAKHFATVAVAALKPQIIPATSKTVFEKEYLPPYDGRGYKEFFNIMTEIINDLKFA
jgi:hypothetical protein